MNFLFLSCVSECNLLPFLAGGRRGNSQFGLDSQDRRKHKPQTKSNQPNKQPPKPSQNPKTKPNHTKLTQNPWRQFFRIDKQSGKASGIWEFEFVSWDFDVPGHMRIVEVGVGKKYYLALSFKNTFTKITNQ